MLKRTQGGANTKKRTSSGFNKLGIARDLSEQHFQESNRVETRYGEKLNGRIWDKDEKLAKIEYSFIFERLVD